MSNNSKIESRIEDLHQRFRVLADGFKLASEEGGSKDGAAAFALIILNPQLADKNAENWRGRVDILTEDEIEAVRFLLGVFNNGQAWAIGPFNLNEALKKWGQRTNNAKRNTMAQEYLGLVSEWVKEPFWVFN